MRKRDSRFVERTTFVRERIGAGVPVAQIARDLARRCGTAILYTSFWEFAVKLLAESRKPNEEVRFETEPAQQAQRNWADFGEIVEDGGRRALSLFVMVLGYSWHTFACLTTSMDEAALQRAHEDASPISAARRTRFSARTCAR